MAEVPNQNSTGIYNPGKMIWPHAWNAVVCKKLEVNKSGKGKCVARTCFDLARFRCRPTSQDVFDENSVPRVAADGEPELGEVVIPQRYALLLQVMWRGERERVR